LKRKQQTAAFVSTDTELLVQPAQSVVFIVSCPEVGPLLHVLALFSMFLLSLFWVLLFLVIVAVLTSPPQSVPFGNVCHQPCTFIFILEAKSTYWFECTCQTSRATTSFSIRTLPVGLLSFMLMGSDDVSELRQPTGLLFIP
jgi:hypothetical protein